MQGFDVAFNMARDQIIGSPSHHQVSNLGIVQFKNNYDPNLIKTIADKALSIKKNFAQKKHLNLNYIRAAHVHIPEILELVNWTGRLERLEFLVEVPLEIYPISIISSIITFTSNDPDDGAIVWHADGVPVTELVPLSIENLVGGELEFYLGSADEGLARFQRGEQISSDTTAHVKHEMGYSVLGQLMRLMHRVRPVEQGFRVTLNLNLRSRERPYIDDNSMCYLAADNPDFGWQDEYIKDVKERLLPAYLAGTLE